MTPKANAASPGNPPSNPQAGRCPQCQSLNLLTASRCMMCYAPLTPIVSPDAKRGGRPVVWGSASLLLLILGIGSLAYRHSQNPNDAAPPSTLPTATPLAQTIASPAPVTVQPTAQSVPPPAPLALVPVAPVAPRTRRRVAKRLVRRTISPTASPNRSWSFESSPAAPRVVAAGPDAEVRGMLNAFAAEDVNNLANQIRSASSLEELNALEQLVSELQDRYTANGAGAGAFAINWLKVAIRQKRSGPNPAGISSWPQALARAESLAAEATRRARMTPEERNAADNDQFQRILQFENQSNRRNRQRGLF